MKDSYLQIEKVEPKFKRMIAISVKDHLKRKNYIYSTFVCKLTNGCSQYVLLRFLCLCYYLDLFPLKSLVKLQKFIPLFINL